MSLEFIQFLVIALLICTIINLWISLHTLRKLQSNNSISEKELHLPIGSSMPYINGHFLESGASYTSNQREPSATVIVFLSTHCSDCRKKIPELIHILPAIESLGIDLIIIGMEKEDKVRQFLQGTPLLSKALSVDKVARQSLNPQNATPFYLFVDADGLVQASYFIGDDNWLAFLEQMEEALDIQAKTGILSHKHS